MSLASFLNISVNLLLVAHVIVVLLLILVVMMQRPKQEGLGAAFGGGLADAAWGAKTTDVLQKATGLLGTLFFVLSFALAILMGQQVKTMGLGLAPEKEEASMTAGEEKEEVVEDLTKALDKLEQQGEDTPAEPAANPATQETPAGESNTESESSESAPVETSQTGTAVGEAVEEVKQQAEEIKEQVTEAAGDITSDLQENISDKVENTVDEVKKAVDKAVKPVVPAE